MRYDPQPPYNFSHSRCYTKSQPITKIASKTKFANFYPFHCRHIIISPSGCCRTPAPRHIHQAYSALWCVLSCTRRWLPESFERKFNLIYFYLLNFSVFSTAATCFWWTKIQLSDGLLLLSHTFLGASKRMRLLVLLDSVSPVKSFRTTSLVLSEKEITSRYYSYNWIITIPGKISFFFQYWIIDSPGYPNRNVKQTELSRLCCNQDNGS